jgi:probable rRNA maturation factor
MDNYFSITNFTKWKIPKNLLFQEIKDQALSKKYELSLVFVGKKRIKKLNQKYRLKDKVTDILSFPLTENSGEIFICIEKCKTACKKFDRNLTNFVVFLFIHGLMHLKGMEHSDKMERAEEKIRERFDI